MPRTVIVSLTALTVLIGLYSVVAAQTPEVPHWQEHRWREHYLQSLNQLREIDPQNSAFASLYALNDQYVDKFISTQTGETREQVYRRLDPFSTDEFNKHAAILLESYRAGDCQSTLSGQCYMLTIMLWAMTDKVLIPLGTTVPWTMVTDPNYRPEWADWNIPAPPAGATPPVPAPISTPTPVATATARWNGHGDPGEIAYKGWKSWTDSASKFRLYVPQNWTLEYRGDIGAIQYYSPDRAAFALVYEFDLSNATQADLRVAAMKYVELLKERSDVLGAPTIRPKQNEVTGWTEYVIQWEQRPTVGDCEISGTQTKELWVLGERSGSSNEGRLLALDLTRCKSATTHQQTLNAIESRFQYWR